MQPFIAHTSSVAILWRENVDTDQIIPKEHLKAIKRTGFGSALFSNWRYRADGSMDPAFELNRAEFQDATILLTGNNFGCGSSREHAVWSIAQYGFRAMIAPVKMSGVNEIPGFADIFKNNSLKNGLLPIELPMTDVLELKAALEKAPRAQVTIDLQTQTIVLGTICKNFPIDSAAKGKLLRGLDEIGESLLNADAITAYEKNHDAQMGR